MLLKENVLPLGLMPRFLLALLLLVSLWPAAAGVGMEVRAQDRIAPLTALEAAEPLRAAGGIEILLELERKGSPERSNSSPSDLPPSGGGSRSAETPRLIHTEMLGRQSIVLPRLDHLPYFATAPPR